MEIEWPSAFETDSAIIYALDSNFRLAYCNVAWDRFARENGGPDGLLRHHVIGNSVMEVTPAPLKPFYAKLYAEVLYGEGSADHIYECSAPAIFRKFHMHLERMDLSKQGPFVVVTNSLILEQPLDGASVYNPGELRQVNGLIMICAHCRRTRVPDSGELWIWVPELVRGFRSDVSHGFCAVCYEIHYR